MKSSILLRLTQKYLVSCFIVVGFWSDPQTLTLFWRLLYLESVSIIFALAVGPIPFGVSTIANISIRTNASTSTSWTLVFCTQSWSHYFLGDSYLFWQIGALQLLALELSAPWIIFYIFYTSTICTWRQLCTNPTIFLNCYSNDDTLLQSHSIYLRTKKIIAEIVKVVSSDAINVPSQINLMTDP